MLSMEMGRENKGLRTKPWEAASSKSGSEETIKGEKAIEGKKDQPCRTLEIKKRQCLEPRMAMWLRSRRQKTDPWIWQNDKNIFGVLMGMKARYKLDEEMLGGKRNDNHLCIKTL